MELVGVLLLLWLDISCVTGNAAGPPVSICTNLQPNHPGTAMPGNGGFIIAVDLPGKSDGTGYHYEANQSYSGRRKNNREVKVYRSFSANYINVSLYSQFNLPTRSNSMQKNLQCNPFVIIATFNGRANCDA